jgi:hypothetical protein
MKLWSNKDNRVTDQGPMDHLSVLTPPDLWSGDRQATANKTYLSLRYRKPYLWINISSGAAIFCHEVDSESLLVIACRAMLNKDKHHRRLIPCTPTSLAVLTTHDSAFINGHMPCYVAGATDVVRHQTNSVTFIANICLCVANSKGCWKGHRPQRWRRARRVGLFGRSRPWRFERAADRSRTRPARYLKDFSLSVVGKTRTETTTF